jgi:hypothetical protein
MTINFIEYASPKNETSLFKGIPAEYLTELRTFLKSMKPLDGKPFRYRIRARGPRNGSWNERSHLPLAKAETLAVYKRPVYEY